MMSTMQGSMEITGEYLCLENAALSPRLMNVLPAGALYPTTIEITLPAQMAVIPFGDSEARAVAHHEDGTTTWRYETDSTGGILYAGDYIREDIAAGDLTIAFYYGRKHQAVMEAAEAVDAVKSVVDYCMAADLAGACHNAVLDAAFLLCLCNDFFIVGVAHGVFGVHGAIQFRKRVFVTGDGNALHGAQAEMAAAFGTDVVGLHFLFVHQFFAMAAFDPHAIWYGRRFVLFGRWPWCFAAPVQNDVVFLFKQIHGKTSSLLAYSFKITLEIKLVSNKPF